MRSRSPRLTFSCTPRLDRDSTTERGVPNYATSTTLPANVKLPLKDVASKYLKDPLLQETPRIPELPRRAPYHTQLRPSAPENVFQDAYVALQTIDKEKGVPLRYEGYAKIVHATHVALASIALCSTVEALELAEFYARQLHTTVRTCLIRREKLLLAPGEQECIYMLLHYNPNSAKAALESLENMYRGIFQQQVVTN